VSSLAIQIVIIVIIVAAIVGIPLWMVYKRRHAVDGPRTGTRTTSRRDRILQESDPHSPDATPQSRPDVQIPRPEDSPERPPRQ